MNPEIIRLQKLIAKHYKKIKDLRDSCPHINFESSYGSNDGNYDPSADRYWVNFKCLDCGQTKMFDSEENGEKYRKFGPKYK